MENFHKNFGYVYLSEAECGGFFIFLRFILADV